jgi:hypothetical protein
MGAKIRKKEKMKDMQRDGESREVRVEYSKYPLF